MRSFRIGAAALGLGSTAYAALSKQCPSSNVCYSLSIPSTTAQSGNGDIFFQLSAPTSYEWVALGQGTQMAGSNIFIMYTSADGNNVTVSPRLGTGHVQPQHDNAARITLLAGSGVENGMMTANVQCSNCQSWSGGSMDFTSSSASWIYAVKSGSPLNSDDLSESISQHDTASSFTWQLAAAKGGSDVNPFVSTTSAGSSTGSDSGAVSSSVAGSGSIPATCTPIARPVSAASATLAGPSGSGCPTAWPTEFSTSWPTAKPTWVASCFPSGRPSWATGQGSWPTSAPWSDGSNNNNKHRRDDGCPSGYESVSSGEFSDSDSGFTSLSLSAQNNMLLAHGVLACIAFVALFPIGGILIRVASFTGLIWVHAALQMLAYLIYIVAFGMGVYMASQLGLMQRAHPIIGIVLFVILLAQPALGFLHHKMFVKYGHRTSYSYAHIGIGRIAILLGMVNGGLGIQLAGSSSMGQKIAYGVVTAIMAIIYIAAITFGEIKRKRNVPPSYEKSQRGHRLQDLSSSEENMQNREYYGKRGHGAGR